MRWWADVAGTDRRAGSSAASRLPRCRGGQLIVKHNSLLDASSFVGPFWMLGKGVVFFSKRATNRDSSVKPSAACRPLGGASREWGQPRLNGHGGLEAAPASAPFTSASWASIATKVQTRVAARMPAESYRPKVVI